MEIETFDDGDTMTHTMVITIPQYKMVGFKTIQELADAIKEQLMVENNYRQAEPTIESTGKYVK